MDSLKEVLKEIVGPDWVSDEPEVLAAYGRDRGSMYGAPQRRPEYVVLPQSTEEVQQLVKTCNRYRLPVIPATTGINLGSTSIPARGGVRIDFKRMNKILEIDTENMSARIQPCVTFAQLQTEAKKKGLVTFITAAPSTGCPLANSVFAGDGRAINQTGMSFQQIMNIEMVLPDATILRTGSFADTLADRRFWWHGPGADLTHLPVYVCGEYGIVTEMTWKLHPMGSVWKAMHVFYPDIESAVRAHNELARREIPYGLCLNSCSHYGQRWADSLDAIERSVRAWPLYCLSLSFMGTERQVKYEEKVVSETAKNTGGRIMEDTLPSVFTERFYFTDGCATKGEYCWGTLVNYRLGAPPHTSNYNIVGTSEILPYWKTVINAAESVDPEYARTRGRFWRPIYIYTFNWGQMHVVDHYNFGPINPKIEDIQRILVRHKAAITASLDGGYGYRQLTDRSGLIYQRLGTYHELAKRVKRMLDPNDIANPGIAGFT